MTSSAVPLFADRLKGFPPPGAFATLSGGKVMQAEPAGRLRARGSAACPRFDF